jgi:bHLH factor
MEAAKRTSSKDIDVVQIVDHISKKQKLDKNVSTNIDISISKEIIDKDKSSIENNFTDDSVIAAADNGNQATKIETNDESAEKNVAIVNENKVDENVENGEKNVDNNENKSENENKNKNKNESTTENGNGDNNVKTNENSEYSEQVIDPVFGSHGTSSNTNEDQTESQPKTQIVTQTETRTEAQIETKTTTTTEITTDNHPPKQEEDEEQGLEQTAKENEEQKDQIALVSTPVSTNSISPPKKSNMADPDMLIKIKKLNHKEVERRRRETINNAIRELQEMVPTTHTNKAQVIKKASEYIKKLKDKQENLLNKWTLEKIITDQAVNELSNSNNKLKTELERAYREIEHRKNVFENFTEMVSKQSNSQEVTVFLSKVDELFMEEEEGEEEEEEEDDDNEEQEGRDHDNVNDNEEDSNDANIEQNLEAEKSNEGENKVSNEKDITLES